MSNPLRVVIGRFQVPELTEGHKAFLNKINPQILFLGVSPLDGRDATYPYIWQTRFHLGFPNSPWIYPLADHPSDQVWSERLDMFLAAYKHEAKFILYGGRDSFIPHYHGKHETKQIDAGVHPTGTEIRRTILRGTSVDFRKGQAYTLSHQWPHVYATVDVAIFRNRHVSQFTEANDVPEVLLIKRADTGEWGLIGGFVDPNDRDLITACQREVWEEVGVNLNYADLTYAYSGKIADWRYAKSQDGIMTSLFIATHQWGDPSVSKEVTDFKWWSESQALNIASPIHQPLIRIAFKHWSQR